MLQHQLKKSGLNYVSKIVETKEDFENALYNFSPDIILSDYSLPSFDGLTAFRIRQEVSPETPFIFVSGTIGEENAVELIKNGVTDYVLKDRMYQIASKILRALNEIKERKHKIIAEQKLKQSEEQLQKIMDQSLDVICTVDQEGNFVKVSAASKYVWGYSPEELHGKNYADLVHENDLERTTKAASEVINGIEITHFENRYIRKNSEVVTLFWSARWDPKEKLAYCVARDASMIKKAEKQLEESLQHTKNILESITDGFFTVNRNWIVNYWNKEAEKMLGIEKEVIVGKNLWVVYADAVPLKFYTEYHWVMKEGVSSSFEEYYAPMDVWFGVNAYPSNDGISVFLRDITENRRQEKLNTLEKEVLKFYTNKKSSLAGAISFLLNGIQEIHPEMLCTVLRAKDGKLYNWASPRMPKSFNEAIKGGIPIGMGENSWGTADQLKEKVVVTDIARDPFWKDIREFSARYGLKSCTSYPIYDANKNLLGIFTIYFKTARSLKKSEEQTIEKAWNILRHVVENKMAEDAIRKSEEVRRLIMNSTLDAIICMDTNGAVTLWNPQAENIFGWKEEEMIGKSMADYIIPQQYRQRHQAGINRYLQTGQGAILNKLIQITALNHHNKEFPVELTIIPIKQVGTEIFCAFIRDITERKHNEEALRELNEQLNKRLEAIEEHNKKLQEIAWMQSHVVRAPLARIMGLINLLNNNSTEVNTTELLNYISISANELDDVIRAIVNKAEQIEIQPRQ